MKSALKSHAATRRGFTLIEVIGTLAIIATLATLLLPKLFGLISQARVVEAVGSYNAVRTAAVTYAARFGLIGDVNGAAFNFATNPPAATDWDRNVLFKIGLLDQSFRALVAEQAIVQVRPPVNFNVDPDGSNSAYHLTTLSAVPNHAAGGGAVLDVRLVNVNREDALELNRLLDGPSASLGESGLGNDFGGRVKYDYSAGGITGLADVYLYLTHL